MRVQQGEGSISLVWSVASKGEGTEIAQAFNKLARSFAAKGANSLTASPNVPLQVRRTPSGAFLTIGAK
jgi:hypothetical protein